MTELQQQVLPSLFPQILTHVLTFQTIRAVMAGGAADEHQIRLEQAVIEHRRQPPPPLLPRRYGGPREVASPPIPDELLLDIFLRLRAPADLVRASAACVSFRCLVAGHSFLRRYRKLHAPPLLGFLDDYGNFHPADPPHSSASAASAVALAADFSFSFLPDPAREWVIQDIRDGRVLLLDIPCLDWTRGIVAFREMAVCDPLHRRYLVLPPVPGATVEETIWGNEAFLVPPDNDEETSFRVMLMRQGETKLFAFVFSSNTEQWRALPSMTWIDLLAGSLSRAHNTLFYFRTYASGCFYWVTKSVHWMEEMKMLVFNTQRMEFFIAEPPPEARRSHGIAMVEAGEGRLGMFLLESGPLYFSLHYTIKQKNGGSAGQWQREKTISLSPGSFYELSLSLDSSYELAGSVEDRYLLLLQRGTSWNTSCFTLDSRTFQLHRVCSEHSGHAYCNFPPAMLSSPTVSSGTQEGAEKEMMEQGMEALRVEEPIDADAAGRASVSRIGDGPD